MCLLSEDLLSAAPSQEITLSAPTLTKGPFREFLWEARVGVREKQVFQTCPFFQCLGVAQYFEKQSLSYI